MNYDDLRVQQRIRRLLDGLGLCGCGSGQNHEIIFAMLERSESRGSFYRSLEDIPGYAVEFIAHVMTKWGLLEHGTGIGYSWLTDTGKVLLQWYRDKGTDQEKWPEWWCSVESGSVEW